ncbi:MAG TPA: hypothetical protein VE377_19195 [Candidatus Dormibacteraeota bacterium]|nr:hypothetical protein [Candidatus Dormibacteraeota bacterium]
MSHKAIPIRSNPPRKSGGMSASCKLVVDAEKQLVVVTFVGRLTVDDVRRYTERLAAHPSFRPSFAEITDLREAEEIDLQAEDFLRLADHVDPFAPEAKRAFVVTTPVQSHAARMHKILGSERTIEIFHSFEEADRWTRS